MTPTRAIILALAAKRLTRLAVEDTITQSLREKVWQSHPPENHGVGYILTCNYCASIYAGVGTAVLAAALPRASDPLLTGLALSEVVSLWQDWRSTASNGGSDGGWG